MEVFIAQTVSKHRLENIDVLSRNQVGDRGKDAEGGLAVLGRRRLCALEQGGENLGPVHYKMQGAWGVLNSASKRHLVHTVHEPAKIRTLFQGGGTGHFGNSVADLVADRLVGFLREARQEVSLHCLAGLLLCDIPKRGLFSLWVLVGDSLKRHTASQNCSKGAELGVARQSCIFF